MNRRELAAIALAGVLVGRTARAEEPPTTWDGLVRAPSKKLKFVYLAPDADFRPYTKVMIDPTEIAFNQKWLRQYNDTASFQGQLTANDIRNAVTEGVKQASGIFDKAFAEGGYQVVTSPAHDVLRVRTALLNIQVSAPDVMIQGRTFSTASAAGVATLVVEVRDSMSNALLGRAVDERLAGDNDMLNRNRATNWSDFRELAKTWAQISVDGLHELQALAATPATSASNQPH